MANWIGHLQPTKPNPSFLLFLWTKMTVKGSEKSTEFSLCFKFFSEIWFYYRQLDELVVGNAQMDGFLLHLQNEQNEAVIKEQPHLHIYSSNDVDMWVLHSF